MVQNNEELKLKIGKNISEYRKLAGFSQLEFADKLNYSDKAVSKWERGESLPDIIILKQIADLFGITVNDLLGEKDTKRKRIDLKKLVRNKHFILNMSISLVWLIATIIFVSLQIFNLINDFSWLIFIYALPVSSIIAIVFFAKWKKLLALAIAESLLIWSVALSFCLSIRYEKIWLILIIAIPLQLLTILWNWYLAKKRKI